MTDDAAHEGVVRRERGTLSAGVSSRVSPPRRLRLEVSFARKDESKAEKA